MNQESVDLAKLRVALRQMSRGELLRVAERAIEIVPDEKLDALVGDMVQISLIIESGSGAASVLEEVRKFHEASLRGDYFEHFDVNGKNCTDHSKGTDAFIAEFDRLTGRCLEGVAEGSYETARESFKLLFALLRRIDEDPDSIVFFADEAGAWQVPVDWNAVLPVYFRCLAESSSSEDFAREVDRVISDFCHHQRPQHVVAAQRVANVEQQGALARLSASYRRCG